MTLKHSPSPWEVAGESSNDAEAFVIEGQKRTIAWTCNTYDDDLDEEIITPEDRANAKLIASAPDLYTYLHQLCGVIRVEFLAGNICKEGAPHLHDMTEKCEQLLNDMETTT